MSLKKSYDKSTNIKKIHIEMFEIVNRSFITSLVNV